MTTIFFNNKFFQNINFNIFYSEKCFFKGPYILSPNEIQHAPNRLFYKQEMFLSTVEGMHPIVAIVGKCAVLDYGEYICSKSILLNSVFLPITKKYFSFKVDPLKSQKMMYSSASQCTMKIRMP